MSKQTKLLRMLEVLRGIEDHEDFEIAHGVADDLLVEALQLIAKGTMSRDVVDQLISAYNKVGK